MKRLFYPAFVIIIGLLTAQIVFSILVYRSNTSLHQNLTVIQNFGYLTVPNEQIIPSLMQIGPAFFGGIFFSLTAGTGFTLLAFLLTTTFCFFQKTKKQVVTISLIFYIFLGVCLNLNGSNIPITVCFLVISAVVILLTLGISCDHGSKNIFLYFVSHAVFISLIIAMWIPKISPDIFIEMRDNLLLVNPLGKKINTFYYQYTLYPAETFKSLDQKLIKSCRLNTTDDKLNQQIKEKLLSQDYLTINTTEPVNLEIDTHGDQMTFFSKGIRIFKCRIDDFLNHPKDILKTVSDHSDNFKFFRKFTFFSLIIAAPLMIYVLAHTFFMGLLFCIKSDGAKSLTASLMVLCLSILFVLPLYKEKSHVISEHEIKKYLKSDDWRKRMSALKYISDKNISFDHFSGTKLMIDSPWIPERYWLAKSMSNSRTKASYNILRKLLNDPHPNVVCMAMYSLGKRDKSVAVPEILQRIKSSDHWYVQWYAYNALKRLGWNQKG